MPTVATSSDNHLRFTVEPPLKGAWTHSSPMSCPPAFFPTLTNVDLPGGVVTAQGGNEVFLDTAYPAGTLTLLCDRRTVSATNYICATQGANALTGAVYVWVTNAWVLLRSGLTGIATAPVIWSWVQYGTDLYISNPYDGVYRYDGDTLIPCGARALAQMESDEAAQWSNETADTTNFREGIQSIYAETAAGDVTMTYTPTVDIVGGTGRYQARSYLLTKATGTDFISFKVMFSDAGTINTTNTKVVITDTAAKSLTWPYTAWDSDRAGTAMPSPPTVGTWYTVYLKPTDATESATFNPAIIDTIAFTVSRSAGTLRMNIDDLYLIYSTTFPAVSFLAEWKNILWGANTTSSPDALYYSPSQAPDEFDALATFPIKTRGEFITGLRKFYTQLVVTAENTTHSLSGSAVGYTYPAYLFDQQLVSQEHGCSSHRSIEEANNKLYWWYKGMIVEYKGTGTSKLSYQIDPTCASADMNALQYIVGAAFRAKNQIWWTWRRSGQSVNDRILRYDYLNNAFLPSDGPATPVLYQTYSSGAERLLTVDITGRKVYRMDSTTLKFIATDGDNDDIVYVVDSPILRVDDSSLEWLHLYLHYLTNTGTLTLQYRCADHLRALTATGWTTIDDINQAVTGELGYHLIGDRSTLLQLRLTSTGVMFQVQFPLVVFGALQGTERRYV